MDEKTTRELQSLLSRIQNTEALDEYLTAPRNLSPYADFCAYFLSLPAVEALSRAELVRRSGLERTYAYQILNGTKAHPGRDKLLCLCIAAGLTVEETQKALQAAREAPLYARDRRDAILQFAINRGCSVTEASLLLDELGETPLS